MKFYELTEEEASRGGFYTTIDECIEKSIGTEEKKYSKCLETKSKKECDGAIREWRESIKKMLAQQGCIELYNKNQCANYKELSQIVPEQKEGLEKKYNKCLSRVEKLCSTLPEKF